MSDVTEDENVVLIYDNLYKHSVQTLLWLQFQMYVIIQSDYLHVCIQIMLLEIRFDLSSKQYIKICIVTTVFKNMHDITLNV